MKICVLCLYMHMHTDETCMDKSSPENTTHTHTHTHTHTPHTQHIHTHTYTHTHTHTHTHISLTDSRKRKYRIPNLQFSGHFACGEVTWDECSLILYTCSYCAISSYWMNLIRLCCECILNLPPPSQIPGACVCVCVCVCVFVRILHLNPPSQIPVVCVCDDRPFESTAA